MAFLAACIPTACYGTYTACMLIIYDMHAPIRHSYAQKKNLAAFRMPTNDMPPTCLRSTCLRHAYTACLRHAYDMHAYDMHAYMASL